MRKTPIHIIQWTLAHPGAASAELLDLSASAIHVGPAVVALVRYHALRALRAVGVLLAVGLAA
jgi:hypothetical protein